MTRVRLSVDHMKDEIVRYLEAEAASEAETIAAAIREAVDAFDFDQAVQDICRRELQKFVEAAAGSYFRALLKSNDAHAVVRDALRNQLGDE